MSAVDRRDVARVERIAPRREGEASELSPEEGTAEELHTGYP